MRFIAALLLVTPVLARDSDRRAEPQSPYLPLVLKNPGGKPETQVGVLDSRSGRLIWDRTIRLNSSRIATLSAYGNAIQVAIETEENRSGRTFGFDLKSGAMQFEHPGTVRAYLQWERRRGIVLGHPEGLTCLDAGTGEQIWCWHGKTSGGYLPMLDRHRLLVGVEDGFAVVDGDTGTELWRRVKSSEEKHLYGPARLWILKGKDLLELDLESGKEGRRHTFGQPPTRADAEGGFVYCQFARSVQALEAETLAPSWTWDAPAGISGLFATRHGISVDTLGGNRKHLLDPETGTSVFTLEVPEHNGSGYTFTRSRLFVHRHYKQGETPQFTIVDTRRGAVLGQGKADGFQGAAEGPSGYLWRGSQIWRLGSEGKDAAWIRQLPAGVSEAMNHAGRLLIVAGPSVVALDPLRGDLLWRWPASGQPVLGYWR